MMLKSRTKVTWCILSAICAILFSSCGISGEDSFRESFVYDITPHSKIVSDTTSRQVGADSSITVYTFSTEPGASLVFEYQRSVHPPDNVTDAGLVENLVFQIPTGTTSFEIRDDELTGANTFYRRSCFCPESGAGFRVMDGFIEGETLSANIWFVRADVNISQFGRNFNVAFEHIFRIKP